MLGDKHGKIILCESTVQFLGQIYTYLYGVMTALGLLTLLFAVLLLEPVLYCSIIDHEFSQKSYCG
jgi:hypothetical protein